MLSSSLSFKEATESLKGTFGSSQMTQRVLPFPRRAGGLKPTCRGGSVRGQGPQGQQLYMRSSFINTNSSFYLVTFCSYMTIKNDSMKAHNKSLLSFFLTSLCSLTLAADSPCLKTSPPPATATQISPSLLICLLGSSLLFFPLRTGNRGKPVSFSLYPAASPPKAASSPAPRGHRLHPSFQARKNLSSVTCPPSSRLQIHR